MHHYETLIFEQKDKVAFVTLNRPDAANGFNFNMSQELVKVAEYCRAEASIRAVVLTATGKIWLSSTNALSMAILAST